MSELPESAVKAGAEAVSVLYGRGAVLPDEQQIAEAVLDAALAEGGIVTREQHERRCGALTGDSDAVHAVCDKHHLMFPGTWPHERVQFILDDHDRLAAENEKLLRWHHEMIALVLAPPVSGGPSVEAKAKEIRDALNARAALTREDNDGS